MSYDVRLYEAVLVIEDECPTCGHSSFSQKKKFIGVSEYHNYTYNMYYAIKHGGIDMYSKVDSPRFTLDGSRAKDAVGPLKECLQILDRDEQELTTSEPVNGWGSVKTLKEFLRKILQECERHPYAFVKVT